MELVPFPVILPLIHSVITEDSLNLLLFSSDIVTETLSVDPEVPILGFHTKQKERENILYRYQK